MRRHSIAGPRDARVRAELARLELMHNGRLVPEFDDVVGAFVRPDHELYGWVNTVAGGADLRSDYGYLPIRPRRSRTILVA